MKTKGCLAGFVVLLTAIATLIVVIKHVQGTLHPVYHGKHLVEWADEAVLAEDHITRQRAVEVLCEACSREGEEARRRVYKQLVITNGSRVPRSRLPEEVLPFLLERFKEEDFCAAMVAGGLEQCPPSKTVPLLIEMLKDERNSMKQYLLIRALGRIGPPARAAAPLIRPLLPHMDAEHKEMARWALKQIDPKTADPLRD